MLALREVSPHRRVPGAPARQDSSRAPEAGVETPRPGSLYWPFARSALASSGGAGARTAATAAAGLDLGPGRPLDAATRARFEPRLGFGLGGVRVHSDDRAAGAARALEARAWTLGRDVVFGAGEYRPDTAPGQRLLAHELAHVAQQHGAGRSPGGPAPAVQRQPDPAAGGGAAGPCGKHFLREFLGRINGERAEDHRGVPRQFYVRKEKNDDPGTPVEELVTGTELDVGQKHGLWRAVCFRTRKMPIQILWVLEEYIENLDETKRKAEEEKKKREAEAKRKKEEERKKKEKEEEERKKKEEEEEKRKAEEAPKECAEPLFLTHVDAPGPDFFFRDGTEIEEDQFDDAIEAQEKDGKCHIKVPWEIEITGPNVDLTVHFFFRMDPCCHCFQGTVRWRLSVGSGSEDIDTGGDCATACCTIDKTINIDKKVAGFEIKGSVTLQGTTKKA